MLRRIAEALERIADALEALDFNVTQEQNPREEKINKMFTEGLDNILSWSGRHAE